MADVRSGVRFKFRVWLSHEGAYTDNLSAAISGDDLDQGELDVCCTGDIIEQCTGLKDKNGKLIYEGDIIIFPHWESPTKEVIHWRAIDSCWHFGYMDDPLIPKIAERCEVIGNIHENQELLSE
jgi:hypothetical protein